MRVEPDLQERLGAVVAALPSREPAAVVQAVLDVLVAEERLRRICDCGCGSVIFGYSDQKMLPGHLLAWLSKQVHAALSQPSEAEMIRARVALRGDALAAKFDHQLLRARRVPTEKKYVRNALYHPPGAPRRSVTPGGAPAAARETGAGSARDDQAAADDQADRHANRDEHQRPAGAA